MKQVAKSTNNIRAKLFTDLFDKDLSANIGAKVNGKSVSPKQLNKSVTKLYDQVFDPDISLRNMENIVNDMKKNVYNQQAFLDEESFGVINTAFQDAFTDIYNPKVMRASATVSYTHLTLPTSDLV